MTMKQRRRHAGFTLVELLVGLTITAVIGAAVASMLFGAARGTSAVNDRREMLVRQRTVTGRINAAVREARQVLVDDPGTLVLWIDDFNGDGHPDPAEQRRIERDGDTGVLRSWLGEDDTPAVWATGVAGWQVALDAPLQSARLVSYRLRIEVEQGAPPDEIVASAALRNTP